MKKSVLSMLPKCIARVPARLSSKTLVNTMPTRSTIVAAAKYAGKAVLSDHSVHLMPKRFVALGCGAVRREGRYRRPIFGHLLDDRQRRNGRGQDSRSFDRQLFDEVIVQPLAPVDHREERTHPRSATVEIADEARQLVERAHRQRRRGHWHP